MISDAKLTNPAKAITFIEGTGAKILAPSIGNLHGSYINPPNFRQDILKDLQLTFKGSIPLCLHGTDELPDELFIECIANGITKININSWGRDPYAKHLASALQTKPFPDAVEEATEERLRWILALLAERSAMYQMRNRFTTPVKLRGVAFRRNLTCCGTLYLMEKAHLVQILEQTCGTFDRSYSNAGFMCESSSAWSHLSEFKSSLTTIEYSLQHLAILHGSIKVINNTLRGLGRTESMMDVDSPPLASPYRNFRVTVHRETREEFMINAANVYPPSATSGSVSQVPIANSPVGLQVPSNITVEITPESGRAERTCRFCALSSSPASEQHPGQQILDELKNCIGGEMVKLMADVTAQFEQVRAELNVVRDVKEQSNLLNEQILAMKAELDILRAKLLDSKESS
ncbi:putative fructose-bisphosphate aldolase [Grifola frondosa]|uniref:Fructose-bisphosphate aldolase n=1 Tax=Grifola frondosa TaxID=5627 RepID=A0A1C7M5Q1_GRIFR|nr:putative fructose-bisphosphate aldolase [Grifola frondosa]